MNVGFDGAKVAKAAQTGTPTDLPPTRLRFSRSQTIGVVLYHLLALLALLPWFFSWTGVILAVLGIYVFGVLGINIGYHRLLTHKSFVVPKWLERTFTLLGVCCLQGAPDRWVAIHRRHHQHADEERDPHSPIVSFFWAHMGWVLIKNEEMERGGMYFSYSKDIRRDPLYAWLDANQMWIWVNAFSWVVFFVAGFAAGLLLGWTSEVAAQFGSSLLVWGVFVRSVLHWHFTWSVNSVTHLWGYRNYDTPDDSRNNALIAFISNGEGWHNNHHADPRSARHGHKWWEFDVAWLTIRLLMLLGLATDVNLPGQNLEPVTDDQG